MKKKGIGEKPHLKKNIGSRSGHGSTGFGQVVALADLLTNSNRSTHRASPNLITMIHKACISFLLKEKKININIFIFKI